MLTLAHNNGRDIQVLKTYGAAPYGALIKKLEKQIKEKQQSVDEKIGVKVTSQSFQAQLPKTYLTIL